MRYRIEPMRLSDLAQVMAIEKVSFPTAWPVSAYRRELLHNRLARYLVALEEDSRPPARDLAALRPGAAPAASPLRRLASGFQHLVSPITPPAATGPSDRSVAGYLGLWLMVDEVHITTVAVAPAHRRKGLGEFLLIAAVDVATEMQASVLTLEVRVSNDPAIRLYEKYGFRQVGRRKNYYTDTREDALIMTTEDIRSPAFRERFEALRRANAERLAVAPS